MNLSDIPEEFAHWSPEAERGVIGGLLEGGEAAFDAVGDLLQTSDFYGTLHMAAFAAVQSLAIACKPTDLIVVFEEMKRTGSAGDFTLMDLHECAQHYVSLRTLREHAAIVAERAASRAMQKAGDEVRNIASDVSTPVADRLSQSQSCLEKLQAPRGKSEPQPVENFIVGFLDRLQALADGDVQPGIPTHIPDLDAMLGGGLKSGKQIIIAARPSVGKSSLAQQVCLSVAQQGFTAAMFSMEMGCQELTDRAVANIGHVPLDQIGTGKLQGDGYGRVSEAVDRMRNLPLFFDDQPAMSLGDIVAKAKALKRKHNLRVLAIDYLQLCSSGRGVDNRHHQIEEISRGLKALAKQLDITVVTLSQLNREVEKRSSGRPVLSDLKESGAIEEDADVVLMLWRHQMGQAGSVIGCGIPKNRQGRVGEVALHFDGAYQRWTQSSESLAAPAKQNTGSRYGQGEY